MKALLHPQANGPVHLARRACAPRTYRRLRVCAQAAKQEEVVDGNVNAYCSIDADGKRPLKELTLGEKEQLFIEALSAYYYGDKAAVSNEEFDNLKEELTWEGSKVVLLSSDEQRFLEAKRAFDAGKPVVSNADYDALKQRLRQSGSIVTSQGPRCSLRTQAMYSDAEVDYLKMVGLNIPPALIVLGALFSVDDLTGFEITKLLELPEPYGIIVLWGFVLPVIYVLANSLTNLLFRDALILKAKCPNCGAENTSFFGDILGVQGSRDKNTVDCSSCKSKLTFTALDREVEVTQLPNAAPTKKPAAAK